ncbi:MAG TPA: hypothetical protein VJ785_15360 [Anaerolineales bacterium]|nr:hypothetical protein [Anaerolineales bacterium]
MNTWLNINFGRPKVQRLCQLQGPNLFTSRQIGNGIYELNASRADKLNCVIAAYIKR